MKSKWNPKLNSKLNRSGIEAESVWTRARNRREIEETPHNIETDSKPTRSETNVCLTTVAARLEANSKWNQCLFDHCHRHFSWGSYLVAPSPAAAIWRSTPMMTFLKHWTPWWRRGPSAYIWVVSGFCWLPRFLIGGIWFPTRWAEGFWLGGVWFLLGWSWFLLAWVGCFWLSRLPTIGPMMWTKNMFVFNRM